MSNPCDVLPFDVDQETGSSPIYYLVDYLGRVRELWPAHRTKTGCLVRETSTSIEVSRSGLDGAFEDLIAKEDIRTALGLEAQAAFRLADVEEDVEGSWALLIGSDSQEFILVRNHDGGPLRYFGCFDLGRDQRCEILGFYRSAVLIAQETEAGGGFNTEWFLIDSGELVEQTSMRTRMQPLYAEWCLLWGLQELEGVGGTYLFRVGSGEQPVPVDDWWLDPHRYILLTSDVSGLVSIAAIEEDGQVLSIHHRQLDPHTPALPRVEDPYRVVLCHRDQQDQAIRCTKIDDRRIAIGYRSRRCEIIEIPRQPGRAGKVIRAIGFTPDEPTSMILSQGPEGDHLVVATVEGVYWFELNRLQ